MSSSASTSGTPGTGTGGRRRSSRSTAAAARLSIQLSLQEERRLLREDAVGSTEARADQKPAPAAAAAAAANKTAKVKKPRAKAIAKARKPKARATSSAASASVSASAPRKVPQPKDWRAGPRRKVANPKRKPAAKKERPPPPPARKVVRKKASARKRKDRDDDGGGGVASASAAVTAALDKKRLGPAKKRAVAANAKMGIFPELDGAERRRSSSSSSSSSRGGKKQRSLPAAPNLANGNPQQQQQQQQHQQPARATGTATAAGTISTAATTSTAATNGGGNKKVEGTRDWDGKPLKTLPFKPFIFSTNFVPPAPKMLVEGTSPFSRVHLHSSRRERSAAAAVAKKTKGGGRHIVKAGIAKISKKKGSRIKAGGDGSNKAVSVAKTARIIGPVPGTSGACMRLSIMDSSATTIAKGEVPSTESCPPLRPAKTVPRLYAQNAQAPIAEESRKLEAEAAKKKRKLKKAKSASRGRSDEVLTIAPLVLRSPTFRGRPLQRFQTMMHQHIVGGDFEACWRRIWSHSAELVTQDAFAMTPSDYAITFDAPQELLEAMLRAQCPLGTNAYTIQHPVLNKDSCTQTIESVLHPETDHDTVSPYLYNDLGQMTIHRAFKNNCAIRLQKMLLHYNPELAISELLTQGLTKRLDREQEAAEDGEYTTLTFWSRSAASAFVDRTDPRHWKANASSGPRCSRKHVRNANEVTSNLFDLAWNSNLERAVMGRKVFLNEKIDTAEKCNDEKNLVDGDRIAIGLMWSRFSVLLKTTYDTYFGPDALYRDGELKRRPVVELFPELAPNAPVHSRPAGTPDKRELSVQRKLNEDENGPSVKVADCPSVEAGSTLASAMASVSSPADETPKKTPTLDLGPEIESFERSEMPPPPHASSGCTVPEPVPLTHNPKPIDEIVVAPSHPALVTALLHHDVALEVITFILRLFPEQCKTKDPHSGLYPIHVVAKGLCPPFRWGWKFPASKDNENEDSTKPTKVKNVRKERTRSTALIPLLLKVCPESANLRDSTGRLPAHYALERGHRYLRDADKKSSSGQEKGSNVKKQDTARGYYDTGLKDLLDGSPSVHVAPDPKTGLYPFMLAATSPSNTVADLTTVYELLKSSPDSVQSGIAK